VVAAAPALGFGVMDSEVFVMEFLRSGHARHLLDEIDGVQRLTIGRNRGPSDHGFTHALIVNLPDEDALRSYLDHPVRKRYLAEHLAPIEEQRIEIDAPVDMSLRPTPVATGNGRRHRDGAAARRVTSTRRVARPHT
jgi:hypothetical protein